MDLGRQTAVCVRAPRCGWHCDPNGTIAVWAGRLQLKHDPLDGRTTLRQRPHTHQTEVPMHFSYRYATLAIAALLAAYDLHAPSSARSASVASPEPGLILAVDQGERRM